MMKRKGRIPKAKAAQGIKRRRVPGDFFRFGTAHFGSAGMGPRADAVICVTKHLRGDGVSDNGLYLTEMGKRNGGHDTR